MRRDHRLRYVDAVHLDAATGEGQCDTACPHTEFQRPTIAGEIGQNIDDRVDHALAVHAGRGGVVAGGDLLVEVPVVVGHGQCGSRLASSASIAL